MIKEINIEHALHNSRVQLFMKFNYDAKAIELVKTLPGVKWSQTVKSWHIGYYPEAVNSIKHVFRDNDVQINIVNNYDDVIIPRPLNLKKPTDALPDLNQTQKEKIKQFKYWLQSKRYSESTIGTYIDAIQTFLRYYASKNMNDITNEDLINFNNDYILANHYSASYQNQIVHPVGLKSI